MLSVFCFVRYSNANLYLDSYFWFGAIIFFLLCGIFIFQSQIWEEEYFERNKKRILWKNHSIKANKGDWTKI